MESTSQATSDGPASGGSSHGETSLDDVATAVVDPPLPILQRGPPVIDPGTRLGRYIVLRPLGHGGMGVVVLADDPELDRRVAIKILRPGDAATGDLVRAQRRLQREAQAIARLSHPNVVSVFDVGTCDDAVYLAMEYVPGDSLRAWLRATQRSLDEILRVFIAAGRGLAAAHHAGLVHRDVKPDNVLVGDDGVVKVLDFGLARALSDRSTEGGSSDGSAEADPVEASALLAAPMTLVGVVMGTPGYMSPEQAAGYAVTARSDQYSLCISLYEAVVGRRPFSGKGRELAKARLAGPSFPVEAKVPRALQRLLLRGLAFQPDARFESMDALVRELLRMRHRRRRTVLWIAIASLMSGAASFGGAKVLAPSMHACETVGHLEAWDGTQRSAVRDAFLATGSRLAEDTWPKIASELDTWAEAWSSARQQACEATLVDGQQTGAVMDMRMSCLDRMQQSFEALVATLGSADLDVVTRAGEAVARLPAIDGCADIDALARLPPMPSEAKLRDAVSELRQQLADAAASRHAGRYARAHEILGEITERVDEAGYRPVRAEALLESGRLAAELDDRAAAESNLRAALAEAERAGYAALRIEVLLDLAFELGWEQKRFGAADELLAVSEAAIAGLGDPPDLHARRRFVAGEILLTRDRLDAANEVFAGLLEEGTTAIARDVLLVRLAASMAHKNVEALTHWREAHAATTARFGSTHPRVADALVGLARSLIHLARIDEAELELRRALEIRTAVFGERSGKVAEIHSNLGVIAIKREDYDTALRELETADRLLVDDPGSVEFDRATMITNLGIVYSRLGRQEQARAMHLRALELLERADPDHPRRVVPTINMASSFDRENRAAEAIEWYGRAIEILLGEGHERRAGDMEAAIAGVHLRAGELPAARLRFRRAIERYDRAGVGPGPITRFEAELELARLALADGDVAKARADLERLLAQTAVGAPNQAVLLAQIRFELGHARYRLRDDRKAARQQAEQAFTELQSRDDIDPAIVQRMQAWLEAHP